VLDPDPAARERLLRRVPGVRMTDTPADVASARCVFLAVKPQQVVAACGGLAAALATAATPPEVVVSIVAGLPLEALERLVGLPRVVRVMPNTPCLVGRGVSAVTAAPAVAPASRARVLALLSAVGAVHEIAEPLMDAVTGLSGSGPGFVARLVEALVQGGVEAGIPEPLAVDMAVATVAGTAALLEQTGDSPAAVREQVTSPGGTTLAGLTVLENRGVPAAVAEAVVTAARRAAELGRGPQA
jgi:pyrroline-5-carboxylate reductase